MKKKSLQAVWGNWAHCFLSKSLCETEFVCNISRTYLENGSTRRTVRGSTQRDSTIEVCDFKDNNKKRGLSLMGQMEINIHFYYCNTDIWKSLISYIQKKSRINLHKIHPAGHVIKSHLREKLKFCATSSYYIINITIIRETRRQYKTSTLLNREKHS